MNVVQRATNIMLQPKAEWGVISAEPATPTSPLTGYAAILSALPFVIIVLFALLLGGIIGLVGGLITGAIIIALGLALLYVFGMLANALAPNFGGVKNSIGATKLAAYSATPIWIAVLTIFIPFLNILSPLFMLAAYGYAAYLFYLGSMRLMGVPPNQAVAYTAVVVLIWLVLSGVIGFIISLVLGAIMLAVMGGAAMTGGMMYR